MFKKPLSLIIIVCFFLTSLGPVPKAHADSILGLPAPGTMVNLSPAYQPAIIRGLTIHKDNPFLFDFIVDAGQDNLSGLPLKKEGEKLIRYFLASLAIPDKDVWVNLSPYEKDKIIPETLGQTEMGRDLLEQDYILKQITASLIYPEKQLGKTFWNKVYAKAQAMYGTSQVPVNTFNKVWIMADRAEVFEHNQTAFVVDQHLKVMLEQDYWALQKHSFNRINSLRDPSATPQNDTHALASKIVREIVLPELEKEVNRGKNFANLRQIFNSIILSSWYKRNLQQALLNQVYADKGKVKGINLNDPTIKQRIYEQYLKAYKKGVFNYIKKDINKANGETIPRKYFSGGILGEGAASKAMLTVTTDPSRFSKLIRAVVLGTLFSFSIACQVGQKSAPTKYPTEDRKEFKQPDNSIKTPDKIKGYLEDLWNNELEGFREDLANGRYDKANETLGIMLKHPEESSSALSEADQLLHEKLKDLKKELKFGPAQEVEGMILRIKKGNEALHGGNSNNQAMTAVAVSMPEFVQSGQIEKGTRIVIHFTPDATHQRGNVISEITASFDHTVLLSEIDKITYDKAAVAHVATDVRQSIVRGGIDLNTSNGMQWKDSKDGNGVEMNVDPAMIERIRREGVEGLSEVVFKITPMPVANIWSLAGLPAPVK